MSITLIRNLDWAIAWDEASASHVYKRGIDLAFDGAKLVHVGHGYAGKADTTIDGSRLMAMPGLVNIHSHPGHEPAFRGIREEHGVRNMYMSGLFERSQAFDSNDRELRAAAAEVASLRAAAQRRHLDRRYRRALGRLGGSHGPKRPSLVPCAWLRFGTLEVRHVHDVDAGYGPEQPADEMDVSAVAA